LISALAADARALGGNNYLEPLRFIADLHRDNHYVPRNYLKRWTSDGSRLWAYRVICSHARAPLWRLVSTRGVAYREHLYTKIAASRESDEVERWLDAEFEAPAEEAIEKVTSDRQLTPRDWRLLARFFAAQDVRTPARLFENLERWAESVPALLQSTTTKSVAKLEAMTDEERAALPQSASTRDSIPFRVTTEQRAGESGGWLKGEVVLGRGLWIWSIRHLLANSIEPLYRHRWTILAPPEGETWFTSDDPVLKVNFNSLTDYTFGGGWGSVGTDLMLPLGPRHMLFTQVGKPVPSRGSRMPREQSATVRRLIAEHAHRYIFASAPDSFVDQVRPRTVNAELVRREAAEWQRFHEEQSAAERALMGWQAANRDGTS
jgi:hypothetical protein